MRYANLNSVLINSLSFQLSLYNHIKQKPHYCTDVLILRVYNSDLTFREYFHKNSETKIMSIEEVKKVDLEENLSVPKFAHFQKGIITGVCEISFCVYP